MSTGKGNYLKVREQTKIYENTISISNTPSPQYIKTKRLNIKHQQLIKDRKDGSRKSFADKNSSGDKDYLMPETSLSPITSGIHHTRECIKNMEEDSKQKTNSSHSRGARLSNSSYQLDKLIYLKQDCNSERTVNKEIYPNNVSDEPNMEETSQSVFTPQSKNNITVIRQSEARKIDEKRECSNSSSNSKSSGNFENDSSSSPEPLSSRLEGKKMMVYETENMQEKYIEGINKVGDQYHPNFHKELHQVSGDKPPTSERMTITDDPDTPSLEFTRLDEEKISITEFDCRDSKVTQLRRFSEVEKIESESAAQHQMRIEEEPLVLDAKVDSKSKGRYSYSKANDESNHILISEEEVPRNTMIQVRYQDPDKRKLSSIEHRNEEEKGLYLEVPAQDFRQNNEEKSIHNKDDLENFSLQAQIKSYKDAYLFQSQYLSGITEKSEEESGYTNQIYKSTSYLNNEGKKHDMFVSSNYSDVSSNINSRLLKYFEDSLQKEIPMAMSPLHNPQNFNDSHQMKEGSKSHSNIFPVEEENKRVPTEVLSCEQEKDGNASTYSLAKSNNYEDLTSNNASSHKKDDYQQYFHKEAEENKSQNPNKRIEYEQIESKPESMNSSMERKERNIKKFIESADNENILDDLSDQEQHLNISSISKIEDSSISHKIPVLVEDKSVIEDSKEKSISRQPTFSRFIPNLRQSNENHQKKNSKLVYGYNADDRSDKNLRVSDGVVAPLLSSISGSDSNFKNLSKVEHSKHEILSSKNRSLNQEKPDISYKSSENVYPQFFASNEMKTFTMSSEGSKKYRSPTFEAISEEENNVSNYCVDSPLHKKLNMDIEHPEHHTSRRYFKRPPSIHAALSPDISQANKEMMVQNPKIIIAHYENIIQCLNKDYETLYQKKEDSDIKAQKLKTQMSDSNKLILKLQEEKESDKVKFLQVLNKNTPMSKGDLEPLILGKQFQLESSSNTNSEENLCKSDELLTKKSEASSVIENSKAKIDARKSTIFQYKASLKQKKDQIFTLNNLNSNLKSELLAQKELEDELKRELIQQKQRRKDLELEVKKLRTQKGQDNISIRKLGNQIEILTRKLQEEKENYSYLQNETDEIKMENSELKSKNMSLERERCILQNRFDKLNRMLTRASADSKRYKSVVGLQNNALQDLQKDYNKAMVDLSQSANLSEGQNFYSQRDKSALNEDRVIENDEKKSFSYIFMDKLAHKNTPERKLVEKLYHHKEGRNRYIGNYHSNSLYAGYLHDSKMKCLNLSTNLADLGQKDADKSLKSANLFEKTLDNPLMKYTKDDKCNISLTEEEVNDNTPKYTQRVRNNSEFKFESKRISTENVIQISQESNSPEVPSSKHEDSFVSASTIKNSTLQNSPEVIDTIHNLKDKFRRSKSRRENRILIQPLPKLKAKSKYEDFRGAQSIERKPLTCMKSNITSLKALKPSSIVDTSQRLTKGSNNYSSIFNPKSSIFSPGTCDRTKLSKDELVSSLDNTMIKGTFKSENRDSASSVATKITMSKPFKIQRKGGNYSVIKCGKTFKKQIKNERKSNIRYPEGIQTSRRDSDEAKENKFQSVEEKSFHRNPSWKLQKTKYGSNYRMKAKTAEHHQKSSRGFSVVQRDV
ncbi:unnamed protein product [Moneuplotes crassus]|uniref:Uncharacterized protein n=1 Tax=Euplotes crassus TaxID=5936 RepID=A0AAD1YAF4_EUPCR|nr:unnamed protein product [Moneuplotes crassus]